MTGRTLWSAVFWFAVAAQFWALYAPRPPSGPGGLPLDKAVHVLLFGVVAVLGVRAGIPVRWLAAGLAVQAVLSEIIQGTLLASRGAEAWDVVADACGIVLGLWLGQAWARRSDAARASP